MSLWRTVGAHNLFLSRWNFTALGAAAVLGYMTEAQQQQRQKIEILTAAELAARLKVLPSWIVEQSKPSRTNDPIPIIKLGKHNRHAWGSKNLTAWLHRRGL